MTGWHLGIISLPLIHPLLHSPKFGGPELPVNRAIQTSALPSDCAVGRAVQASRKGSAEDWTSLTLAWTREGLRFSGNVEVGVCFYFYIPRLWS